MAEENARLVAQYRRAEAQRQAAEGRKRFGKSLRSLDETKAILAQTNQASAGQRRAEMQRKVEASYTTLKSLVAEGKITGIEAAIAESRITSLLTRLGAPR